jgi:hypothetical protein
LVRQGGAVADLRLAAKGSFARNESKTPGLVIHLFVGLNIERYTGYRGMMIHDRDHFFRLVRVAGFQTPELVLGLDWQGKAGSEFYKLTRG